MLRRRGINQHIHVDGEELSNSSSSSSSTSTSEIDVESGGSFRHLHLSSQQQSAYEQGLRDGMSSSGWSAEEEDMVPMDNARGEILSVMKELDKKSKRHSHSAELFRGFNYLASAIIIIGAALVGVVLAFDDYENKYVIWGSFAVSIVKGIYDLFGLSQKGIHYQYVSMQLRDKLRKARDALMFITSGDEMFHFAQHTRQEMDDIEMNLFKASYGPDNVSFDANMEAGGGGAGIQHRQGNDANV